MGILSFFKGHDNYGHQVSFNFNRQGETVNTVLGGFISIIVNILIYGYLFLRLQTMFTMGNNYLGVRQTDVTPEYLGTRSFKEMNMLFYFQMLSTNAATLLEPIPYNAEELASYVGLGINYQDKKPSSTP